MNIAPTPISLTLSLTSDTSISIMGLLYCTRKPHQIYGIYVRCVKCSVAVGLRKYDSCTAQYLYSRALLVPYLYRNYWVAILSRIRVRVVQWVGMVLCEYILSVPRTVRVVLPNVSFNCRTRTLRCRHGWLDLPVLHYGNLYGKHSKATYRML